MFACSHDVEILVRVADLYVYHVLSVLYLSMSVYFSVFTANRHSSPYETYALPLTPSTAAQMWSNLVCTALESHHVLKTEKHQ